MVEYVMNAKDVCQAFVKANQELKDSIESKLKSIHFDDINVLHTMLRMTIILFTKYIKWEEELLKWVFT
jgi:hypothetical protein